MSKSVIELHNWIPRFGREKTDVLLEGFVSYRGEYRKWQSSRVIERCDSNMLKTETGGKYNLIGPINSEFWKKLKYPNKYLRPFNSGFPRNWQEILNEIREQLVDSSKSKVITTRKPIPPRSLLGNRNEIIISKNPTPQRRRSLLDRDNVFDSVEEINAPISEFTPIIPKKKARKPTVLDSSASDIEIMETTVRRSPRNHNKKKINVKSKTMKKQENKKLLNLPNETQDLEDSCSFFYPKSDVEMVKENQKPKIQWNPEDKKNFIRFVGNLKPKTNADWEKLIKICKLDYSLTIDEYRAYARKFYCPLERQTKPADEEKRKQQEGKENQNIGIDNENMDISILEKEMMGRPGTAKFAILQDKMKKNIVAKKNPIVEELKENEENIFVAPDKAFVSLLLPPKDAVPIPRKRLANFAVDRLLSCHNDSTTNSLDDTNVSVVEFDTIESRQKKIKDIHRRKTEVPKYKRMNGMKTATSRFINSADISTDNILPKRTRSLLPEELEEEEKYYSDMEELYESNIDL